MVKSCWRPLVEGDGSRRRGEGGRRGGDPNGRVDGLLWYKDLGQHVNGEFSMAVTQANSLLEDHSQLESGPLSSLDAGPCGTFIGVYDGHGGPETSRFVNECLFTNLKSMLLLLWRLLVHQLIVLKIQLPKNSICLFASSNSFSRNPMGDWFLRDTFKRYIENYKELNWKFNTEDI